MLQLTAAEPLLQLAASTPQLLLFSQPQLLNKHAEAER